MAAPEFTLFVKPYLEGYINGEEGNTPVTAEILNENYDAFLLALNEWATSVGLILESAVTDSNYVHTDNNYTTTEKNKLSGVEDNANNYSLPTASTSTLGGVKVDGITITIANGVISAVGGGGTDVEGNPSGTPTAVLSSIRIGNDIFSIPGGGGGGSSVSFTQILATGTKIGTITIDGVPTDIYAPAPPTNTSDLNNDSNFVSDANYVHTDNNYTTTEKNKLADLNQVEANPSSGTSAGDLTSIEIDGTKYNIPSGGGGNGGIIYDKGYSTTEQAVCGWTDGTTVYQKTFYIAGDGSTKTFTENTGITNGKKLVQALVSGVRHDTGEHFSQNYINIDDPTWSTSFVMNSALTQFTITAKKYAIEDIIVTLRYLKTTDVPFTGVLPLNELSDVDITTPTNGQVLAYNSTTGMWENANSGSGSQEITPISNVDYSNLTPQQKANGQVYLVSPVSSFSPDYTASNWSLYSQIDSAYHAEINDGQLEFVILSGGGTWNDYAKATYKVGIDLTNVESIVVNTTITYMGATDREIQIGLTDTLPGNYSIPTLNPNESLATSSSWTLPTGKSIELDTSELTGTYYLTIKANGKTAFTVDSIAFNIDAGNIPNEIYHMNKKFSQYPGASGGSGHTILDDAGTELSQEDNLQFKGVYVHDDSTNEKTVVEVVRSMTLAQYQALSADEKKGVIAVTDDSPAPYFTDVVGTLVAGATSITLSDAAITTSSTIEVFDEFDIPYNNKTLSNGSITLTFDAQQNDIIVKVRVS